MNTLNLSDCIFREVSHTQEWVTNMVNSMQDQTRVTVEIWRLRSMTSRQNVLRPGYINGLPTSIGEQTDFYVL
jgi:hypothetical protein